MYDRRNSFIMATIIYPSSFKLPLCWLHSLTPFAMLPGIRSLAVAMHLEIYWV